MKALRNEGYGIPVLLAIGLHVAIIVTGLVSIDLSSNTIAEPKRPPIVNASIVDVSQTIIGKREAEAEAARQKQAALAEKKKKEAAQKQKQEARRKALEEKKKQLAQAKAREEELKRAREQKQQQEQAKALALKEAAEQQRLAQQKAKQLAKEKAQESDKQRQEENARIAQARLAEEEKKRQQEAFREAQKKRQAEEASRQAAAEELAKQQAAEEAQMVQSISGLINDRVTAAWIRPPNARNGMITHLRIYFLPTGEVRDVKVTQSSGDALFDQRAIDAVKKVGRIEELAKVDSYVFERNFRQVDLIFNPQDLRN